MDNLNKTSTLMGGGIETKDIVSNPYEEFIRSPKTIIGELEYSNPEFVFSNYTNYGLWKNDFNILQHTLVYSEPHGVELDIPQDIESASLIASFLSTEIFPITDIDNSFVKLFYNPENYTSREEIKKSSWALQFINNKLYPPQTLFLNIKNKAYQVNIEEQTLIEASRQVSTSRNCRMHVVDDQIYIDVIDAYFRNIDVTASEFILKFTDNIQMNGDLIKESSTITQETDSEGRVWNHVIINKNLPVLNVSDFPGYEFYKNELGIYAIFYIPSINEGQWVTLGIPLYLTK